MKHLAAATVPVIPAGQLGLYAPSRWHPPRTSLSGDQEQEFRRTRERVLRAVSEAGEAYAEGIGYSGNVVVAQIR